MFFLVQETDGISTKESMIDFSTVASVLGSGSLDFFFSLSYPKDTI